MTDMSDAVSELVKTMKPTEPIDRKDAVRYFNGLFFSGTLDECKLDHRILSFIVPKPNDPPKTEGRIASHVVMQMRDPKFQASLARLEANGLIVRCTKEWGWRGEWIELSDNTKTAIITNKGQYFGTQNLRQLGVEA